MDWFLFDIGLRRERVKKTNIIISKVSIHAAALINPKIPY